MTQTQQRVTNHHSQNWRNQLVCLYSNQQTHTSTSGFLLQIDMNMNISYRQDQILLLECKFMSLSLLWNYKYTYYKPTLLHDRKRDHVQTLLFLHQKYGLVSRFTPVKFEFLFSLLTLETGISAKFDVGRNVVLSSRVRQAHSGSKSPMTSQNVNCQTI